MGKPPSKSIWAFPVGPCVKALSPWGKDLSDIEAVFVTHDHGDHVGHLFDFDPPIPVYATPCSLEKERVFETIDPYVGISVGAFTVFPFSVSHDAPNPVNYIIMHGEERFGYVTDTGELDEQALALLEDCDYYLFESNYDPTMLRNSHRPDWLKKRIRGKQGHLSNGKSARYLSRLIGEKTKAVYLGHLSLECNTPEKALEAHREEMKRRGLDGKGILLKATEQFAPVYGGDRP